MRPAPLEAGLLSARQPRHNPRHPPPLPLVRHAAQPGGHVVPHVLRIVGGRGGQVMSGCPMSHLRKNWDRIVQELLLVRVI